MLRLSCKFPKIAATGMQVPRKTHAPPSLVLFAKLCVHQRKRRCHWD